MIDDESEKHREVIIKRFQDVYIARRNINQEKEGKMSAD